MHATTVAVDLAKDVFEVALANRAGRILEDAELPLPGHLRHTLAALCDEVCAAERRVTELDRLLARLAAAHPVARRLLQIPGIGVITATALVGAVAHIHAFRRARHCASWLGLTPRERSRGLRRYLGRISKRGDVYLRCLLTHGARAVLLTAHRTLRKTGQGTRFQHWAVRVAARRGHNTAAIAVANQLARIVWAVWHREVDYVEGPCVRIAASRGAHPTGAQRGRMIMADRSDRHRTRPITPLAEKAVEQRLAPGARLTMMARSAMTLHSEAGYTTAPDPITAAIDVSLLTAGRSPYTRG